MKESLKKHWKLLLPILCILLMTLVLVESTQAGFFSVDQQTDPNVFKYVARVIKDGGMPYRDTFDHKGPLLYVLNFIGISINYTHGLWLIQVLLLASTFFIIFTLCKKVLRKSSKFSLGITILSASLLLSFHEETFNIPETYILPLVAGSLYIFMDFYLNNKLTHFRSFLCGIFLGLATMVKPNYAAIWMALSLGAIYKYLRQKDVRGLICTVALFLMGAIVAISPFIAWIAINGAWSPFVYQFILFNLQYASSTEWSDPNSKAEAFFFLLNNIFVLSTVLLSVFLLFSKNFSKKEERLAVLSNLTAIFAVIIVTAAAGKQYPHYGFSFLPFIFLPFTLVLSKVTTDGQKAVLAIASLSLISTSIFIPWSNTVIKALSNLSSRNDNPLPQEASDIVNIIKAKTTADDKITVVGSWDLIYNQAKRFSASRYSYQYPISLINPDITTEYFSDLANSLPKILVFRCSGEACDFYNNLDELGQYIKNNNYSLIYENSLNDKVYYRES